MIAEITVSGESIPQARYTVASDSGPIVVGRAKDCDICIAVASVCRRDFRIDVVPDVGSMLGSRCVVSLIAGRSEFMVNGVSICSQRDWTLSSGDQLSARGILLQVSSADTEPALQMRISRIRFDAGCLAVTCSGVFGVGSAGNSSGEAVAAAIENWIGSHPEMRVERLLVDYSDVQYSWGDGVMSSLIRFVKNGVGQISLVGSPENIEAIRSLVASSKLPWFSVLERP